MLQQKIVIESFECFTTAPVGSIHYQPFKWHLYAWRRFLLHGQFSSLKMAVLQLSRGPQDGPISAIYGGRPLNDNAQYMILIETRVCVMTLRKWNVTLIPWAQNALLPFWAVLDSDVSKWCHHCPVETRLSCILIPLKRYYLLLVFNVLFHKDCNSREIIEEYRMLLLRREQTK